MVVSATGFQMQGRDYMVINARDVSERERQRLEREAIVELRDTGGRVRARLRVGTDDQPRACMRCCGWRIA